MSEITVHGIPGSPFLRSVEVTLKEKGSDKVLDKQMVKVDPNGKPVKFRLTHQPTEPPPCNHKTHVIRPARSLPAACGLKEY